MANRYSTNKPLSFGPDPTSPVLGEQDDADLIVAEVAHRVPVDPAGAGALLQADGKVRLGRAEQPVGAVALGALGGWQVSDGAGAPDRSFSEGRSWTMPRIEFLPPPAASRARTLGLIALRAYLLLAATAVIVKVVQLMVGS